MKVITDFDRITDELNPTGAIEVYLWDELVESKWDSIESLVSQLEMASCSAGSWSGMIYTQDILDRLADPQWVTGIEEAVADYESEVGETPIFDPYGSGFSLTGVVTFAVDWTAQRLASRLRTMGKVAVVTVATDSLDAWPDVVAFASEYEAQDWVSEEIQRRVDCVVQHSQHTISETELESLYEQESALLQIDVERL